MSLVNEKGQPIETEEGGQVLPGGLVAMEQPASVVGAMTKIMGEIERLPKNGWNDFHRYYYPTESDVMDTVRPLCAKHGLAVIPNVVGTSSKTVQTNQGESNYVRMVMHIWLIHEDGGKIATRWESEAIDSGDKATYKCYSNCLKYFALKTFLMSSEDDVERESPERKGQQKSRSNGRQNRGRSPQPPGGRKQNNKYPPMGLEDHFKFGKYRPQKNGGKKTTLREVINNDVEYLVYLNDNKPGFTMTKPAKEAANRAFQKARQQAENRMNGGDGAPAPNDEPDPPAELEEESSEEEETASNEAPDSSSNAAPAAEESAEEGQQQMPWDDPDNYNHP